MILRAWKMTAAMKLDSAKPGRGNKELNYVQPNTNRIHHLNTL